MGLIEGLNKAFDSRVRIGIMAALSVNDQLDFNSLKKLLDVTDGNLASHMKALEDLEYVKVDKRFVGRKPKTSFSISKLGRLAFKDHISNLEKILRDN
jgi:DNA-binding MarR family transcriptional regulator